MFLQFKDILLNLNISPIHPAPPPPASPLGWFFFFFHVLVLSRRKMYVYFACLSVLCLYQTITSKCPKRYDQHLFWQLTWAQGMFMNGKKWEKCWQLLFFKKCTNLKRKSAKMCFCLENDDKMATYNTRIKSI